MPQGDGRLNHDLDPHDRGPQDACGVFGVWAPDEEVAKLAYFGIYALQHRGQESAGIAVSKGTQIVVFKDMGLVSQVFNEATLNSLGRAHLAIGHCRYSTTGASVWKNAQPTFRSTASGGIALGHNGNLTNTLELQAWLAERDDATESLLPGSLLNDATTDTSLVTALLATFPGETIEQAAMQVLPRLRGAFSLVFMDEETLYAARDPQGIRPLVLGRLERGWVVASETAALDIVGASFVREIIPGELIAVDGNGLRSSTFAPPEPKGCLFEYVYLARPDTMIAGTRLHSVRVEVGRTLAREFPADADLVIPVPESGTPAAIGYAEESGIPYGQGLVKNSYVGRTFIQPSQTIRQLGIRLKLNPLRDVIAGQAAGGGRRLHRPRQHPAGPGPDVAGGRSGRGARTDLLAAGEVAVLLRHRLRLPGRADRHRPEHRGDLPLDRRRFARLRLPGRAGRRHPGRQGRTLSRLLRRGLPGRAAAECAAGQVRVGGCRLRRGHPGRGGRPAAGHGRRGRRRRPLPALVVASRTCRCLKAGVVVAPREPRCLTLQRQANGLRSSFLRPPAGTGSMLEGRLVRG